MENSNVRRPIPALATGGKTFPVTLPVADGKLLNMMARRPSPGVPLLVNVQDGHIFGRNEANGRRTGRAEVWADMGNVFNACRIILLTHRSYHRNLAKLGMALNGIPFALQFSYDLTAADSRSRAAFSERVRKLALPFSRAWDERNMIAHRQMQKAAEPLDSIGRFNPSSSRMRLWTSNYRLGQRQTLDHVIDSVIDDRRLVLRLILDRIWNMVNQMSVDVHEIDIKVQRNEVLLTMLTQRLRKHADRLSQVAVAPFGVHAFPHCVRDLREAATAYETGQRGEAHLLLDRVERCIKLLRVHQTVEDMLLMASVAKEESPELPSSDARTVGSLLDGLVTFLTQNALLDRGFKHKIQADVLAALVRARVTAHAQNAAKTYQHLKNAAQCF